MLEELPKPLRGHAEKLPVIFEPRPNGGLLADGIEPDTLGLFTSVEFIEENDEPLPPQIILFLENIWEIAKTNMKLFCEEVRITFLQELGHYFGLNENELVRRRLQ